MTKAKSAVVEVACKYSISKKIVDKLGLTDEGKIDKFFDKVLKLDERAINQLEANKKADKLQYDINVEQLEEQIEDAKEKVNSAYLDVSPENVTTNKAIESYVETYWHNVKIAEDELEQLQEDLKSLKEDYKEQTKYYQEQINKYKERMQKIIK